MALLAVWLRSPAFGTNGFHNEDAAGITYNADLLLHGLLPLVDNFEVKAPGSFYVVAAVWSFFGRSMEALQVFMCFWSILAAIGVYVDGAKSVADINILIDPLVAGWEEGERRNLEAYQFKNGIKIDLLTNIFDLKFLMKNFV